MKAYLLFKSAIVSIWANRIRSVLTTLGIVIGISAVIAMLSVGNGAQQEILNQVQALGSNTVVIVPVPNFQGPTSRSSIEGLLRAKVDRQFLRRLENDVKFPELEAIAPAVSQSKEVTYKKRTKSYTIYGVTSDFALIYEVTIQDGRQITERDNQRSANIAVIGPEVARGLFGETDPIGKKIMVNGGRFEIVGVAENENDPIRDSVFVPLNTAQLKILGERDYSQIAVKVSSEELIPQVIAKIEDELRDYYRVPANRDLNFSIVSFNEIVELVGDITGIFTTLLTSIAGISLLVGGIGIMNIMLVSVTERTKEIGLRKAVGAKEGAIMFQFLVEAILLTVIGGILGAILGFTFALLVSKFGGIPVLFTVESVLLATSVAAAIGLTFGFYPAYRAAKLNPIDALRYE